jgi:3-methyladenine DNA glycosylase AlkD
MTGYGLAALASSKLSKTMPKPPAYIAAHLRQVLINGASAPHSIEVQRFFKEQIQSRGWYTKELRKLSKRFRKVILNDAGLDYLLEVADELFHGEVLEEKTLAVYLLQDSVADLSERQFKVLEKWLDRVSSWADHDALAYYLLGKLIAAEPKRVTRVFVWAKSKNRWHRRAAAVSLIPGARAKQFVPEMVRLAERLLDDKDDMVQKGLGWLLREAAKFNSKQTVPLLMSIRERAPRLVLRTGCEKLDEKTRIRILAR